MCCTGLQILTHAHHLWPLSSKNFLAFVCLRFFVPLENFSFILRRHHCQWMAAKFDRCSALMAIEQNSYCSMAISADIGQDLLTSLYEWNILVWDEKLQTNITVCLRILYSSCVYTYECESVWFKYQEPVSSFYNIVFTYTCANW